MKSSSHTVYDIARMAGVSPSTVSRVITGVVKVAPDKEKRVREVMEQVDFRPNASARTLLRKRSFTLGVIMPDITNLFFSQTFLALERAAAAQNYSLLLGNTLNSGNYSGREQESFYLNSLFERQVDGILFMGGRVNETRPRPEDVDELVRFNRTKPIVIVNGTCPGTGLREVKSAEPQGMAALVDHLIARGHRDFGLLGGERGITSFDQKLEAALACLAPRGLSIPPEWIQPTGFMLPSGFRAMESLLKQQRRPTALLCINDYVAMGAIRHAVGQGLSVPGDFAVTGFDDIQTSEYVIPSLTTCNQGYQQLAEAAISVVLELTEGNDPPAETLVPTTLVVRESTALGPGSGGR